MLRIYMILCIPLLEQDSVCCVQYSFTSFDILLLTFWHYCKICRFPKLTVWKEYFTILMWFFLFCLNGKCRLGKFQGFFFYQFHCVNSQYIYYHIKTLWSLIKIIPLYSVFSFEDNKIFSMYKCNVQSVCMYVWFDYSLYNFSS